MKKLQTVLNGLFCTAVATVPAAVAAYCGHDPTTITAASATTAASAAAAAAASAAWSAAGGALGNFVFDQTGQASELVTQYLSKSGNGDFPLNYDLTRAVRMAQISAVKAIAHRVIDLATPTEHDRSAQLASEKSHDQSREFLKIVHDWGRSVENDLKTRALELLSRDEVEAVARNLRALVGSERGHDAKTLSAELWKKAGNQLLAELNDFKIVDRPALFDDVLEGRDDVENVTLANATIAFFIDILKHDEVVFRIVIVDLTKDLGIKISALKSELVSQRSILSAIQEGLGPVGQALSQIDKRLRALAEDQRTLVEDQRTLSAKVEQILAILTSVRPGELLARLDRWVASEYADYRLDHGLAAADVRTLIDKALSELFVGREPHLAALDRFLAEHDRGLITVGAPAGVGKSALLLAWMGRRRDMGDFVARHIIARSAPSTVSPQAVLKHLLRQVQAYRSGGGPLPSEEGDLADEIFRCLKEPARAGERLIVLIDGLDEADAPLVAFVREFLGSGVYIVLGVRAQPREEPRVLKEWLRGAAKLPQLRRDLEPLSVDEIVQWLRATAPLGFIKERQIAETFHRSTDGIPLFLSFFIEDFIKDIKTHGLQHASNTSTTVPGTFAEYVGAKLDELDGLGNVAWSTGARKLFAILTQTLGPISSSELISGKLIPRDLNLRRIDNRIERWFLIAGDRSQRTFVFAHPLLATVFAEVLGFYADGARTELFIHCERWAELQVDAYALTYAPDHLIAEAARQQWTEGAIRRAAAPLQSLDFHQARLALPDSDKLTRRASQQLTVLAEKTRDGSLSERLRVWASALAEAAPMVAWDTLKNRDEAPRLLSVLITDFSSNLGVVASDARFIKPASGCRGQPPTSLRTILAGHTDSVEGALALTDGRLLSWSKDGTLRLWSAQGEALGVLAGHTSSVNGALVLADGRLLSWSGDGTLRLWGAQGDALGVVAGLVYRALVLADGRLLSLSRDSTLQLWSDQAKALGALLGHTSSVNGVLELADGRLLSWSRDGTLRLWSAKGESLSVLAGHTDVINGVIELADGRLLSRSWDHTLRLWSAHGKALSTLAGHTNLVNGALALADGRLLSWSWDDTLRLWSAHGDPLGVLAGHTDFVIGALELADGRLLSWSDDSNLRLWSARGDALGRLAGHRRSVNGALALTDGRLLSWSNDGTLRLWSAQGEALGVLAGHTSSVNGVLVLADGRLLSWSGDGTLRLWSAQGEALGAIAGYTRYVEGALALADGRLLSWSDDDGTLRLWSARGEALGVLAGHTISVEGALALADGRLLSWSNDGTFRLWSAQGDALGVLAGHTLSVNGALALGDGRLLSWSWDKNLRLWSAEGEALGVLLGHTDSVVGALALADGRLLSWSDDGTLRLWSAQGEALGVLLGHTSSINGALALADGRLLSWSWDNNLRLWSAQGDAVGVLLGHTSSINGALAMADGRLLSWSADSTLRLWSAQGEAFGVLAGHTDSVVGALALADGRLLSWSRDGTLRLWSAQEGEASGVFFGHTRSVEGALALTDGRLLSWSRDGTLRLWSNLGAPLELWGTPMGPITKVVLLADQRTLAVLLGRYVFILTC